MWIIVKLFLNIHMIKTFLNLRKKHKKADVLVRFWNLFDGIWKR